MADVSYNIPDLRPGEVFRVEQTIKRSRFIASVGHTPGVEEAKAFIEQIKAEFEDARHNCWAYCAGAAGSTDRIGASDDGEPHGTAGRPMLTAVTHSSIGEVTVVVTRYFGGILLGTGGLVKAYQSSVKMALEGVPTRVRTKTKRIKFSVEHRFVNQVLRKIEAVNGRILEKNFDMGADFDVEIPEDLAETFAKELEELTRGALLIEFVEE
ncbi:YigZ family protein [Parasutterella excrementihominis]|uniref:YigZ family protein n=1 Tax=Parasutterella excrementihominis TaxID=487175 RepID=UPI00242D2184|nr:YigZ family protein [Parasutterella excrementihominis]